MFRNYSLFDVSDEFIIKDIDHIFDVKKVSVLIFLKQDFNFDITDEYLIKSGFSLKSEFYKKIGIDNFLKLAAHSVNNILSKNVNTYT